MTFIYALELSLLSARLQCPGQRQPLPLHTATESEGRRGAAAVAHGGGGGGKRTRGRGLDSDADHLCRRVNTHHKQLASQVVFHILLIHLSPLLASAALKLWLLARVYTGRDPGAGGRGRAVQFGGGEICLLVVAGTEEIQLI